jgi:Homeodomain-like domain
MPAKYIVTLTADERAELGKLVQTGTAPGRTRTHAQILLKADQGPDGPAWADDAIKAAFDVGSQTIHRVRQSFVEAGLDAALHRRRPTGWRARKLDGAAEAHLLALACATPPTGRKHWPLRLLADQLVVLGVAETVSHETVRTILKKTRSSRG